MARIFSISYDEALLRTRQLMLQAAGHEVTSALGYQEAVEICTANTFHLAIIGHSIPKKDKLAMIECFRRTSPDAKVIALTRAGENSLNEVDYYVNPGDPEELLRSVAWIINPASDRRQNGTRGVTQPELE